MTSRTNEFKKHFPALTAHTSSEKLEHLVSKMKLELPSKGKTLLQEGVKQDRLFFLINGVLSASIIEKGKRLELGDTVPGNIVGEISIFGNCSTTATIVAKTDCKLLTLNKSDLIYLQESTPEILGKLLRLTAKTIADRIIMSDKLLYQKFCDETLEGDNNLPMFLAWCAHVYQQIHGYERIEK